MLRADARASILEIALAEGLTHMGRLAADYRAIFGERPSETVRREARSSPLQERPFRQNTQ
ncbi:MAG: helix-turn-helix domain-containing protein [Chthoniobacter sp.]|nr:helix-turn-helix domain-containing protein [Chthoniobacter sp.]